MSLAPGGLGSAWLPGLTRRDGQWQPVSVGWVVCPVADAWLMPGPVNLDSAPRLDQSCDGEIADWLPGTWLAGRVPGTLSIVEAVLTRRS